jgi:hypothetical protein
MTANQADLGVPHRENRDKNQSAQFAHQNLPRFVGNALGRENGMRHVPQLLRLDEINAMPPEIRRTFFRVEFEFHISITVIPKVSSPSAWSIPYEAGVEKVPDARPFPGDLVFCTVGRRQAHEDLH